MFLGILQFDLLIHDAQSLKDKRRVVKSVKDRLHREHMISVAEVGAQEIWNVARMGLAVVAGSGGYASDVLDRVTAKLRALPDAELGDCTREIVKADQLPGDSLAEDGSPLWTPDEKREDDAGARGDRVDLGEA